MEIVPLNDLSPTEFESIFEKLKNLNKGITAKLVYSMRRDIKNRLNRDGKYRLGDPIRVIYHDVSHFS